MTLLSYASDKDLSALCSILDAIEAREARITSERERKEKSGSEARALDERAAELRTRTIDLDEATPPQGIIDRILNGERITDGAGDRAERLHHNAVVDREASRLRIKATALRDVQRECDEAIDLAMREIRGEWKNFYFRLSQVAYACADKAMGEFVGDILVPLEIVRSGCVMGGHRYDARIDAAFHYGSARLTRLVGNTVSQIWPPSPGPETPTFEEISPAAVHDALIDEIRSGAARNRGG